MRWVLLLGLLSACSPQGLVVRAERALEAHERCAELGWDWAQDYEESGGVPRADGSTSGGVIVTYECRQP